MYEYHLYICKSCGRVYECDFIMTKCKCGGELNENSPCVCKKN